MQKEIIDTVLSQGIKALAVSVIDPENQRDYLNEIAEKVPLLTQDNDAPDTKRKCYIGTDNYLAGKAVGKLVKEAMPEGGILAIFVGDIKPLNARQRRQGVLDELAGDEGRPRTAISTANIVCSTPNSINRTARQSAKKNAVDALDHSWKREKTSAWSVCGRTIRRRSCSAVKDKAARPARSRSSASTRTRPRCKASRTARFTPRSCSSRSCSATSRSS